jgi:hypothetical protein
MALRTLDEFVRQGTQAELEAADEWVAERPEFTVYTNLSRRVQSAPSTLAPNTQEDRRTGLAWVTALARVELASMYATFTSLDSPYEAVGMTDLDKAAYSALLMDAAQTHVWALANDRNLRSIAKATPDTLTLAYLRRLGVVRSLLNASARSNGSHLDESQARELLEQYSQIASLHEGFAATIAAYVSAMNSRRSTSSSRQVDENTVNACLNLLLAEKIALQKGKATIRTYVYGESQ